MREPLDRAKLERFLEALGERSRGPGRVYLVGGATAVWYGWRASTVDVDLRLDPEPAGAFDAIARLKDELSVNVELASPMDFMPEVPGWRERSIPLGRVGAIEVFHYDPVSQALAKISRGNERDLRDARALLEAGHFEVADLEAAFAAIRPAIIRYPGLDERELRRSLDEFIGGLAETSR